MKRGGNRIQEIPASVLEKRVERERNEERG